MTDWKFGDVLIGRGPHPTRIMFISRPDPVKWTNSKNAPEFWGFRGIYLAPHCSSKEGPESDGGCGYDHSAGQLGAFGGHPEASLYSSWSSSWTVEEI